MEGPRRRFAAGLAARSLAGCIRTSWRAVEIPVDAPGTAAVSVRPHPSAFVRWRAERRVRDDPDEQPTGLSRFDTPHHRLEQPRCSRAAMTQVTASRVCGSGPRGGERFEPGRVADLETRRRYVRLRAAGHRCGPVACGPRRSVPPKHRRPPPARRSGQLPAQDPLPASRRRARISGRGRRRRSVPGRIAPRKVVVYRCSLRPADHPALHGGHFPPGTDPTTVGGRSPVRLGPAARSAPFPAPFGGGGSSKLLAPRATAR